MRRNHSPQPQRPRLRHPPHPPVRSPTSTPLPIEHLMPLALVVNVTRPTADVAVAEARRVVASGANRWSAIGQSGDEMRVLTTKNHQADDVLRAVRASPNVLGIVPADAVDARVRVLTVGGRDPLRDPQRYPLRTQSRTTSARDHHACRGWRHHVGAPGRRSASS